MADSLRHPLIKDDDQSKRNDVVSQESAEAGNGSILAGATGLNTTKKFACIGNSVSWVVGLVHNFCRRVKTELKNSSQPAKAGLAAALCSLLCFAPPPFSVFNRNGVWAVITADVVLEPNVGLTISKGLNRTLGTLAAATLALGVNYFAVYLGVYEPFYIMGWVFFGAAMATMFKFRPPFKDRWNYAVAMSMITFHILILSKSDYKDKVKLPLIRLATIIIGFLTMSLVNLGIAPKYAGSSINDTFAKNFERAGTAMERCVSTYLECKVLVQVGDILRGQKEDDNIHKLFTEMVAADAECDKLLKAVTFEPCHGRFFMHYPWDMYTDVADNLRYLLYDVIALDSCLRAEIQAPNDLRKFCKEEFTTIGKECSQIFRLLGESIRTMRHVSCEAHLGHAKDSVELLQHKIAKHTQLILGGALRCESGHDLLAEKHHPPHDIPGGGERSADVFDDAYIFSYSDSVLNTPAPTPGGFLMPTQQAFISQSKLETAGQHEERKRREERELKQETKTRISALSLIKFASLLIEIVAKAEFLTNLVDELGLAAHFDLLPNCSPCVSNGSSPKSGSHCV